MGLFDSFGDLTSGDGLKNIGSDIYDYFGKRVVEPLVKIGQPQAAAPAAPAPAPAAAAPAPVQTAMKYAPMIAAAAAVLSVLIVLKKKGK